MTLDLRIADPSDLNAVYALETEGFVPGIRESIEVFDRRIRQFPRGFLLGSLGSQVVGYFCSEIWTSADIYHQNLDCFHLGHDIGQFLNPEGSCLYIASMTVSSGVRGGGWGGELFRRSLEWMKSSFPRLRSAVLIVNEHWTSAQAIYLRSGFQTAGRIERFFHPENSPSGAALIMEKALV